MYVVVVVCCNSFFYFLFSLSLFCTAFDSFVNSSSVFYFLVVLLLLSLPHTCNILMLHNGKNRFRIMHVCVPFAVLLFLFFAFCVCILAVCRNFESIFSTKKREIKMHFNAHTTHHDSDDGVCRLPFTYKRKERKKRKNGEVIIKSHTVSNTHHFLCCCCCSALFLLFHLKLFLLYRYNRTPSKYDMP